MASSSFNNQQTDVEMQHGDQDYAETTADANATSGASSQANKVKKIVVPRSRVWEHFTRTKETRNKCICHHCHKMFSCASKSGTSNLNQHLQICKEHKVWLSSQNSQKQIGNAGNLKASKVTEGLFREACNELVVLAELPLSFTESIAFKHFCDKVNLFKPQSRRTLTRNIVEMFVTKKLALKNMLIASQQRVSLTTDIWVSQVTGASYMVITAHFIDDQWQLKKLIIGFKYVMDHKGQTICNVLLECLADWGLERLFCITVDNATANTSALTSTLIVSASTKVNAFKCYGEIVRIERNLTGLASSFDSELKLKASEMLKKFLKYWDGIKGVNKMLILATVFDPTKKMHFAKLCFEKLYGKDSLEADEMGKSVSPLPRSMFDEYNLRFKASFGQASQKNEASSVPRTQSQEPVESMELVVEDFGYERMGAVYKDLVAEKGEDTRDELEVYLKEAVEHPKLILGIEFDVLSWWKVHKLKYPVLAEMARDLLAMQVSSVASESAFSTCGRILDPYRSCLTHYMIEVLMCSEQWLHAEIKLKDTIITNEQILADIEELDKLEKEFEAHNIAD